MQKTHIHFALKSYRQVNTLYMWHTFPQGGGGGGGHCGFQVIGMIEWGHESKPTNIPGPKINPQKIPCRISKP